MFEALFILTTVDAGTRVGRFLLQAVLGLFSRRLADTRSTSANLFASALLVAAWGYFLVQGVLDPLGGINSLWPLFGIANQLLAIVALCLCTTLLIKMGKARHLWVTGIPLLWLGTVTFTAALQKIAHPSPKIGFLSLADKLSGDLAAGSVPAEKIIATQRTIFNLQLDAVVCGVFLILVVTILIASVRRWVGMLRGTSPRDLKESTPVWLRDEELREPAAAPGFFGKLAAHGLLLLALVRSMVGGQIEKVPVAGGVDQAEGKAWAKSQEERFKRPKCC
jgi:carbon starvation protein